MNQYLYIPLVSAHPPSYFVGSSQMNYKDTGYKMLHLTLRKSLSNSFNNSLKEDMTSKTWLHF
jgi:hypothetical protein